MTFPEHLSPARQALLNEAVQRVETDQGDNLLGVVLTGSAGRGIETDLSDMDALFVFKSIENTDHLRVHTTELEVIPISIEAIETIATFGGPGWGDRWSYAWTPVLLDRSDGRIEQALERQTWLTFPEINDILIGHSRLDAWINQLYRALKSARDGNDLEARLDGAESVPALLDVLFALNGLVRPYNKYLQWALKHHPLPGWDTEELLCLLRQTMAGDAEVMRETYARIHQDCLRFDRQHGQTLLGDVFATWPREFYGVLTEA